MNANDQPSDGKQSEKQREEVEEVEEEGEVETPDYQDKLLARIRQMRSEGAVFVSSEDMPDSTDQKSQGQHYTMFSTTSRFGR